MSFDHETARLIGIAVGAVIGAILGLRAAIKGGAMNDNQCTFCGQHGHRASHCPRRMASALQYDDLGDEGDGIRDEDRKALGLVAIVCLSALFCGLLTLAASFRGCV